MSVCTLGGHRMSSNTKQIENNNISWDKSILFPNINTVNSHLLINYVVVLVDGMTQFTTDFIVSHATFETILCTE